MNIAFEYLYRDAGNYKKFHQLIFPNASNKTAAQFERQISETLIDSQFFIAHEARLPNLYFAPYDPELDHSWHEFVCLEETDASANDPLGRTIEELINDLRRAYQPYLIALGSFSSELNCIKSD